MKKNDFAFAGSAVRVLENSLLPASFFDSLEGASRQEAARLLADQGIEAFASLPSSDEAERILSDRLAAQFEELASLLEDRSVLDFLIVENDFQNLKASLLNAVLKKDAGAYFIAPSLCDPAETDGLVKKKKWEEIPAVLRAAAEEGYGILTSSMDSAYLRFYLDARCAECRLALAGKTGSRAAQSAAAKLVDLQNRKAARTLLSFERPRQSLVDAAFAEGGSVPAREWKLAVAKKDGEALAAFLPEESDPVAAEEEFYASERRRWEAASREILTPDALFAYYFARKNECEKIRALWALSELTDEEGKRNG